MTDEAVRVRRARARAQLLAGGGGSDGRRGVAEVVAALVGVQAQDEAAAAFSVRARSRGLLAADVVKARTHERSVVLTWSLRGTRHYHHRDDVRGLVGLLGPVFSRPEGRRARQLGIDGAVGEQAVRALAEAMAVRGPLTRAQVKELLAPHGVDPSGQAAIHVVRRAALEGVLCIVPGGDGPERYGGLDDWAPPAPAIGATEAAAELARRYRTGYGPASGADFAAWSGLGARGARAAWEATAATAPTAPPARTRPVPLRLLGGFDAFLLGYAERGAMVRPEHAPLINAGGGLVRPTIASDGEVVGTWAYRRGGKVEVTPFRALSRDEAAALDREVADVERFMERGR